VSTNSISYGFRDKLAQKGLKSDKFQYLNVFILGSSVMVVIIW